MTPPSRPQIVNSSTYICPDPLLARFDAGTYHNIRVVVHVKGIDVSLVVYGIVLLTPHIQSTVILRP
jgi:hypothetical protein